MKANQGQSRTSGFYQKAELSDKNYPSLLQYEKLCLSFRCKADSMDVRLRVVDASLGFRTFFDSVSFRLLRDAAKVIQENHYYPFGQNMVGIEELDQQSLSSQEEQKFQYNAKEKLDEFQLYWNDHGARNLDLQTGRWTAIDPLAEKYTPFSPYVAMGNNPVMFLDLDGREAGNSQDWLINVTQSNGGRNTTVDITLTIAVLNSTGKSNYNESDFQDAIANQIQASYSFKELQITDGKFGVFEVKTQVNIRTISDRKDLADNEHLIEVLPATDKRVRKVYGKVVDGIGGKHIIVNEKYVQNIIDGEDNNTIPHEIGHTGGLFHINGLDAFFRDLIPGLTNQYYDKSQQDKNPDNAMYQGKSKQLNDKTSTKFNRQQIELIIEEYKNDNLNPQKIK